MKRALAFVAATAATVALAPPAVSAESPNTLEATAFCDGYPAPINATVRNANAAFFNQNRLNANSENALVGGTAIAFDADGGPRVGVVVADVVDGNDRTVRGAKPYDERGFETARCDIVVYDFPFEGGTIPVVLFFDVQVKLAPNKS